MLLVSIQTVESATTTIQGRTRPSVISLLHGPAMRCKVYRLPLQGPQRPLRAEMVPSVTQQLTKTEPLEPHEPTAMTTTPIAMRMVWQIGKNCWERTAGFPIQHLPIPTVMVSAITTKYSTTQTQLSRVSTHSTPMAMVSIPTSKTQPDAILHSLESTTVQLISGSRTIFRWILTAVASMIEQNTSTIPTPKTIHPTTSCQMISITTASQML